MQRKEQRRHEGLKRGCRRMQTGLIGMQKIYSKSDLGPQKRNQRANRQIDGRLSKIS